MQRSRVAVVVDGWDFPFNGMVVSTRRFVDALQHEFEFVVLATRAAGVSPDDRVVGFERLSVPGFNGMVDAMKAPVARPDRRLLRDTLAYCDLLHVQFPFFLGASAISVARELSLPVLCSFHVQPENVLRNLRLQSKFLARLLYKLFVSSIYNAADRVIAPSEFAIQLLRANGVTTPVTVVSNGVPNAFFELSIGHLRESRFTVLSVGRLSGEKHQDVILDAVALSRHRDKTILHLVGAGPRERRLRKKAQALGIDARIGAVSDKQLMQLYAGADVFVHAGEAELEGMSVLEAMASGNVVLLANSEASAATELITDPGAHFDNRDAASLAATIDRWIDDAPGRAAAAQTNRRSAFERTHDESVARLADVYRELLQQTA